MEVHNKEMYHYHRGSRYDNVWQVGNEFVMDESFYSNLGKMQRDFNISIINRGGNLIPFDIIIERCLNQDLGELNLQFVSAVMEKARKLILEMGIYNRELALERYRLEHCPELPSRLHSLWFCDQDGLNHWKKQLGGEGIKA